MPLYTADALVLRLPEPLRPETLKAGAARPFISEGLALTHGWVEVPYASGLGQLTRLAQAVEHHAVVETRVEQPDDLDAHLAGGQVGHALGATNQGQAHRRALAFEIGGDRGQHLRMCARQPLP